MAISLDHTPSFKLVTVEDYEPLVGAEAVERILQKASRLRDLHVAHVNSTYYGGGVAELLSSATLLMNGAGIKTGWRVIQGRPDFFSVTKKMHNALQGADINLTDLKLNIYEEVAFENAARNHLDHDIVIVHDPQPLPLIRYYRKKAPWVWRCHVDLSTPNTKLWDYLRSFIEQYDAVVLSCCRCLSMRRSSARHNASSCRRSTRSRPRIRNCPRRRSRTGLRIMTYPLICRLLCKCPASTNGRTRKA